MSMRVKSDYYKKHKKHMEEMMSPMSMETGDECIPVDMYGKRVFPEKSEGNLAKAAKEIQEYYGLEGDRGI